MSHVGHVKLKGQGHALRSDVQFWHNTAFLNCNFIIHCMKIIYHNAMLYASPVYPLHNGQGLTKRSKVKQCIFDNGLDLFTDSHLVQITNQQGQDWC